MGALRRHWRRPLLPAGTSRIAFVTGGTLGDAAARFLKRCDRPVLGKPFSGKNVRALLESLAAGG